MGVGTAWATDGASVSRGGRLFDSWYMEVRDRPPSTIHPKYNTTHETMHTAENSWRCVSCHEWDYSGRDDQGTGELSIEAGNNPAALQNILTDENHQYGNRLSKQDYVDLAAFITSGIIDMGPYIDAESNHVLGDKERESRLYATICANCHGADGQKITSVAPLGTFARNHPGQVFHKILNGHPAEKMPPLRFLSTERLGDLLAFTQTLPEKNLSASIARGGRLYDNWQKEKEDRPRNIRHPAYPREAAYAKSPDANWRCKECHGWDYKGVEGVYGQGRHRTGIKGIRQAGGRDLDEIIILLMDKNHMYHGTQWLEGPLDYQDLIDLANFVAYGQIDMDAYIDSKTGVVKGNPKRRKNEYNLLCATCHEEQGDALATGRNIGDVARENPWEALHKIRNGHPDEAMPALHTLDMEMQIEILAYAQSLPGN